MSCDIKRVSQVFQESKTTDMLEVFKVSKLPDGFPQGDIINLATQLQQHPDKIWPRLVNPIINSKLSVIVGKDVNKS